MKYLIAAVEILFIHSCLFFKKTFFFIYDIKDHFNNIKKRRGIIPKVGLQEIILKHTPIKLLKPIALKGNVSLLETVVINSFVKLFNPRKIFEIGTFDGRTTLNMTANSSSETKIFTFSLVFGIYFSISCIFSMPGILVSGSANPK